MPEDSAAPASNAAELKAKQQFASGMAALLEPVVRECNARSQSVLKAQEDLMKQLELFSAEMAKLQELNPSPHLAPYADKLAASRKKIRKVEMMMEGTKERVANIARMHSELLRTEKAQKERIMGLSEGASRADADAPANAPTSKIEAPAGTDTPKDQEGVSAGSVRADDGKKQGADAPGDKASTPPAEKE